MPRPLPLWRRVQSGALLALILTLLAVAIAVAVAGASVVVWTKVSAG